MSSKGSGRSNVSTVTARAQRSRKVAIYKSMPCAVRSAPKPVGFKLDRKLLKRLMDVRRLFQIKFVVFCVVRHHTCLFFQLKELNHDNVVTFVGASFETEVIYVLTSFCAKGCLQVRSTSSAIDGIIVVTSTIAAVQLLVSGHLGERRHLNRQHPPTIAHLPPRLSQFILYFSFFLTLHYLLNRDYFPVMLLS